MDLVPLALLALAMLRREHEGQPVMPAEKPKYDAASVERRIAGLVARAEQPKAKAWIPHLVRAGAPESLAVGLARWIGIESSGNPLAISRLGERGLLQILPSTAKAVFTPDEIARLGARTTTNEEHARLAIKQFRWHVARAKLDDRRPHVDQLWYAKVHHMRPADLRVTTERPPAAVAAAFAARHARTPLQKLRLATANVVAFGSVTPPGVT